MTRPANPFGAGAEQTPLESLIAGLDVPEGHRERIAARVAEMPQTMQRQYLRSMAGRSPRGAIRAFCRMCVGWQRAEVAACSDPACALFPYRRP